MLYTPHLRTERSCRTRTIICAPRQTDGTHLGRLARETGRRMSASHGLQRNRPRGETRHARLDRAPYDAHLQRGKENIPRNGAAAPGRSSAVSCCSDLTPSRWEPITLVHRKTMMRNKMDKWVARRSWRKLHRWRRRRCCARTRNENWASRGTKRAYLR